MMHAGQKPRTRADKATDIVIWLNLARPERLRDQIGAHTAESFAKSRGVPVEMIRGAFERAKGVIT